MKELIKTLVLMTLLTSSALCARAQKTVAMQFSELPGDAAGAGKADINLLDNILLDGNTLEVSLNGMLYSQSYDPVTYMDFKADYCLRSKISFSLFGRYGMGKEYDIYNSGGFEDGTYRPGQILIGVGAGYRLLDYLTAQAQIKIMSEDPAPEASYNAFAADLSVTGQFPVKEKGKAITELGVYSAGSKVKSASGAEFPLPASVGIQGGYVMDFGKDNEVRFIVKADYYFNNACGAAAAIETSLADIVSIRAGYNSGATNILPSYASVGVSCRVWKTRIDAAYIIAGKESPIANTFSVGISYNMR